MDNISTRKDFETQKLLQPVHFEIGAWREYEREEDRMLYFPVNPDSLKCTMDAIHPQPAGDGEYPLYVASCVNGEFRPSDGMFLGYLEGQALREGLPTTARSVHLWETYTL